MWRMANHNFVTSLKQSDTMEKLNWDIWFQIKQCSLLQVSCDFEANFWNLPVNWIAQKCKWQKKKKQWMGNNAQILMLPRTFFSLQKIDLTSSWKFDLFWFHSLHLTSTFFIDYLANSSLSWVMYWFLIPFLVKKSWG